MSIKRAVRKLTKALRKDEEFYYTYQANIAMAIKDEFNKRKKPYTSQSDMHEIANTGAKNFLNLFIG